MSAVFDPEAVQTIVKKNLALTLPERIDDMDFRSVRHQFWDFGSICIRELLTGKP